MSEPYWTPLGGQPVDYEGAWASGVQYAPGDVVTYLGQTYLAVNPSLASPPPVVSGVVGGGEEVAYAERTTSLSVTATTEATAQTVVDAPAFVADGASSYLVEVYADGLSTPGGSANTANLAIFLDGVSIGRVAIAQGGATQVLTVPARATRRITPSAGSHVVSLRAFMGGAVTGTVFAGPGTPVQEAPAFIRVTKVPTAVTLAGTGVVPAATIGTSLPASPVDGQEFYLTDSLTAPTYCWHLRFIAAKASNKWQFVGGPPLFAEQTASMNMNNAAYVDGTPAGPSISLPVAGDYEVEIGYLVMGVTSGPQAYMSYAIGATAAVDADACIADGNNNSRANSHGARARRKNGLAAVTLTAKYKGNATNIPTCQDRWMRVTPIAVGG